MNRDTDLENAHVDTAGEGKGGTNWGTGVGLYTLLCVKYKASGKLLYNSPGSSALCPVMTQMGGLGKRRREVQESGDICMHMAESLHAAETNTTL